MKGLKESEEIRKDLHSSAADREGNREKMVGVCVCVSVCVNALKSRSHVSVTVNLCPGNHL